MALIDDRTSVNPSTSPTPTKPVAKTALSKVGIIDDRDPKSIASSSQMASWNKTGIPGTDQYNKTVQSVQDYFNQPADQQGADKGSVLYQMEHPSGFSGILGYAGQLLAGAATGLVSATLKGAETVGRGVDFLSKKVASKIGVSTSKDYLNTADQWLGHQADQIDKLNQTPLEQLSANVVPFVATDVVTGGEAVIPQVGMALKGLVAISGPAHYLVAHSKDKGALPASLLELGANALMMGDGEVLLKGMEKIGLGNLGKATIDIVSTDASWGLKSITKPTIKLTVDSAKKLLSASAKDLAIANLYNTSENIKQDKPLFDNYKTASVAGLVIPLVARGAGSGLKLFKDTAAFNKATKEAAIATKEASKAYAQQGVSTAIEDMKIKFASDNKKLSDATDALKAVLKTKDGDPLKPNLDDLNKSNNVTVVEDPNMDGVSKWNKSTRTITMNPDKASIQDYWHEAGHAIIETLADQMGKTPSEVANTFSPLWDKYVSELKYGANSVERMSQAISRIMTNPDFAKDNNELLTLVHATWGQDVNVNAVHVVNAEATAKAVTINMSDRVAALENKLVEKGYGKDVAKQIAAATSEEDLKAGKTVIGEDKIAFADKLKASATKGTPAPMGAPQAAAPTPEPAKPGIILPGNRVAMDTPPSKPNFTSGFAKDPALQENITKAESAPLYKDVLAKQRGGTLTAAQRSAGADALGGTREEVVKEILDAKPGSITTAEGAERIKKVVVSTMQDASRWLDEATQTGDPQTMSKAHDAAMEAQTLLAKAKGIIGTEAGRLLETNKHLYDAEEYQVFNDSIKEFKKISPDASDLEVDAKTTQSFTTKAVKAWVTARYASMLSGIKTPLRIAVGNTYNSVSEGAVKMITQTIMHPQDFPQMAVDLFSGLVEPTKGTGHTIDEIWSGKWKVRAGADIPIPSESASKGFSVNKIMNTLGKAFDTIDVLTTGGYRGLAVGAESRRMVRELGSIDPEELSKFNIRELHRITLSNVPEGTVGEITKGINSLRNSKNPAVRILTNLVMPFTRSAANELNLNLDYNPVTSFYRAAKRIPNIDGSSWEKSADAAFEQAGKAVIGFGLASWATAKIMTAPKGDTNSIWITGAGPANADHRNLWQQTGAKPYSIKIGGTWVPYLLFGGLGGILAFAGSVSDVHHFDKSASDWGGTVIDGVTGFLNETLNQSYLSGVKTLVTDLPTPQGASRAVASFGASAVPMPEVFRELLGEVPAVFSGKNNVLQPNTFPQQILYDESAYSIVGLKWAAEKIAGKPSVKQLPNGIPVQRDLIYGLTWTKDTTDPVTSQLIKNNKSFSVDDKINGTSLSPEQSFTYNYLTGQAVYQVLGQTIDTETYINATPEQQTGQIDSQIKLAKEAAQKQMIKQYPELKENPAQTLQKKLQSEKQAQLNKKIKVFGSNLDLSSDVTQADTLNSD